MVKSYNYFPKELYIRSLTRFLIRLSLNKYSLTCSVTLGYVLYETYSEHWHIRNPVYYCKLRHIQVFTLYSDIFRVIMAYSERCVTLAYSKPCHIQSNIQNFGMFRAQGIFRALFIWTYSGIFNNDSYNNINFHLNLTYFSTKF